MGSFGQDFSQGLALGSSIYNNAQRESRQDQEQGWKAEDRQRDEKDRQDALNFGAIVGKAMDGDFSPAIADANMRGAFGPNKYASGYSIDDKGNFFAHVYDGSGDPATAVNSMEKIPMGTTEDVQKKIFFAHAPAKLLAQVGANSITKQSDPETQQRLQSGALGIQEQRLKVGAMPEKIAQDQAQGRASLAHTEASTGALQLRAGQDAVTNPLEARRLQAQAEREEWLAKNPQANRPIGKVTDDGTGGPPIFTRTLYPGDPIPQDTALAGPGGGTAPSPASAAPAAPAANPAAPQQKKLDAAKVKEFLLKAGGDPKKARAMAESDGWSF